MQNPNFSDPSRHVAFNALKNESKANIYYPTHANLYPAEQGSSHTGIEPADYLQANLSGPQVQPIPEVELAVREGKEVQSSCFLVKRIIDTLNTLEQMDSHQLQDVLSNMEHYAKTLEKNETKISNFLKFLVQNRNKFFPSHSALYCDLRYKIEEAESLSMTLQSKLNEADNILRREKITSTNFSSLDAKNLQYKEFSGNWSIKDIHIYEFIQTLENNFRIAKTSANFKATITKNLLKGQAKLCIPEDMTDYQSIISLLLQRFGSPVIILQNLLKLHHQIGKIPSRSCVNPDWRRIEEAAKNHMYLIRKAEILASNESARPQIFSNSQRNHNLISILPHELVDDLKYLQHSLPDSDLYKCIIQRIEQTLQAAASNFDHSISDRRQLSEELSNSNSDEITLAYNAPFATIGEFRQCSICTALQSSDPDHPNLFINHIRSEKTKRYYSNNCPQYLGMSLKERNDFLEKHQMCAYCLRVGCTNPNCGSDNLTLTATGKKKPFVCQVTSCRRRIELCVEHFNSNKQLLDWTKNTMKSKFNLDYNINAFELSHPSYETTNFAAHFQTHGPKSDPNSPPLLMSTTELFSLKRPKLIAPDSKSIFIFSKIKGSSRGVSVLFDSGGGSSICLTSIPGYQFYASRSNDKPVFLQGVGSGKTRGEPYNMVLPMADGSNVAVDMFAVKQILRPMSSIDLSPALCYFKEKSVNDDMISKSLKDEIQRASIYRFIEGNIDVLLGVKMLGIFPTLIHSLSCGLSIFKMKLMSADPKAQFCLGGPYNFLSNMTTMFPNGAIMLQQIEADLSNWRIENPSCMPILQTQSDESMEKYESGPDNRILVLSDSSSSEDTESAKFWHSTYIRSMESFFEHISQFHGNLNHIESFDTSAKSLRRVLGSVFRHHFAANNIVDNGLIKAAINHLDDCPHVQSTPQCDGPYNSFIAVQINKSMAEELEVLERYFNTFYKSLKSSFIKPYTGHLTLLALNIPNLLALNSAGKALTESINKWLAMPDIKACKGELQVSFRGIDCFEEKTLYLDVDQNKHQLHMLHDILYETFCSYGFSCDKKFTSHLTICRLKKPSFVTSIIKSQFKDFSFGQSSFNYISLRPMKNKTLTCTDEYKRIPFVHDSTIDILSQNSSHYSRSSMFSRSTYTPSDNDSVLLMFDSDPPVCDNFARRNDILGHADPELSYLDEVSPEDIKMVYNGEPPVTDQSTKLQGPSSKKLLEDLHSVLHPQDPDPRCLKCLHCEDCKTLSRRTSKNISSVGIEEDIQIQKTIRFDKSINRYYAELPLKENPAVALAPNIQQARRQYLRVVSRLTPSERKDILTSFRKLIQLNIVQPLHDFPMSVQNDINQHNLYVIPWQVVSKDTSVTTPTRLVLNASHKTRSGKSLNSILCKGLPSLCLLPLVVTLIRDPYLLTLDIMKFYNSCLIPSSQYHLQCMLWNDNLDPNVEPSIYIIKSHMYGLVSSSRILELCLKNIADQYKSDDKFYSLFKEKIYVDDGFFNSVTIEDIEIMKKKLLERLSPRGFIIKGFAQSLQSPPDAISQQIGEIKTVPVIGMIWNPKNDTLKYKVKITFKKNKTNRTTVLPLDSNLSLEDIDMIVPNQITLRSVASIVAGIWDPPGWLTPWHLMVKHLLRISAESVLRSWDDELSSDLRTKWLYIFHDLCKLNEMYFPRCTYPPDNPYAEATLIGFSDYGKHGKIQIIYLLRKLQDGTSHVTLVQAKSQLSSTSSVPCQELDSLSHCATTLDKVANTFDVKIFRALITDSVVTSFWLNKELVKLAPFQRKRVANILQHCSLNNIYHVRSKLNIADHGTKGKIALTSISSDSNFHKGPPYLASGIDECVNQGILKSVSDVIINPQLKPLAIKGVLVKHQPPLNQSIEADNVMALSTSGQNEIIEPKNEKTVFVGKVLQRLTYHDYLTNPLDRPWPKSIKIVSVVLYFIYKVIGKLLSHGPNILKRNLKTHPLHGTLKRLFFSYANSVASDLFIFAYEGTLDTCANKGISYFNLFSDLDDLKAMKGAATLYFIRMASAELQAFYKPTFLNKHTAKKHGIYISKQRILETDQVLNTMDLELDPINLGINQDVPCSDRYSPVAIAALMHYHRSICHHSGVDRSYLASLNSIFVFKGLALMKEIVRTCFLCRRKLKQKCKNSYGPINKFSLTFSAVNSAVMLDLSGPYMVKTHLNARTTRANTGQTKIYVLHTVCLTSYLNTMVIVENYTSQAFVDALNRIGCRYGLPSVAYTDASAAQLKALTSSEFKLTSFLGQVYEETGIQIRVSGTGATAHSRQGRVEKSIDLFKRFLQNKKIDVESLTVLQFDSVLSLAQSYLNSLPLCTKLRQKGTVSSTLVTPYSFLLGRRSNTRAPADIPKLPDSTDKILDNIAAVSKGMYNFFCTNIPNLLLRPKNFDPKTQLNEGDIILFPYQETEFQTKYKLGLILHLEDDSDQEARMAEIAYANSSEVSLPVDKQDKATIRTNCRVTRKLVESLVKIFSCSDQDLNHEIDAINRITKNKADPVNHEIDSSQFGADTSPEMLKLHLSYLLSD